MQPIKLTLATLLLGAATLLQAQPAKIRWTAADDRDASFPHLVEKLKQQTRLEFGADDFRLDDDRDLAFTHYRRYDQVLKDVGIKGMAIRVWTDRQTGELVQVEAQVTSPMEEANSVAAEAAGSEVRMSKAMALVHHKLSREEDHKLRSISSAKYWRNGHLVLAVTAKAHRGVHIYEVDALTLEILRHDYRPYATADGQALAERAEEGTLAQIFPVYEEYKGQILPRKRVRLKHLLKWAVLPTEDPFSDLKAKHYLYSEHDVVEASTQAGRDKGYWSMPWLMGEMRDILAKMPKTHNVFRHGDVVLQGRYVNVSIYPEAFDQFSGVTLPRRLSPFAIYRYKDVGSDYELIPETSLLGRPLTSRTDAVHRDATRDPKHDPATYINAGFDEIQVYYAVTELFESLRPHGFVDPDLAERPFNAFLFDPDIEYKNNAFYTDDTINFTTYSPEEGNAARDNLTIWHELGHGVMDRLMGPLLDLADTGGLSEGMADFVAEMVLNSSLGDEDFPGRTDQRIINQTGFFLTNEVHDDGEAYGGTMKAILDGAKEKNGQRGVKQVIDLVLETMRLCRDHPELTAGVWFEHMRFADSLGRSGVRAKGELLALIDQALASRNFAQANERRKLSLKYQDAEVNAGSVGSRGHEIQRTLAPSETTELELKVQVNDGEKLQFHYPLEVHVSYQGGPLQGAVHWEGEEQTPTIYQVKSSGEELAVHLKARGACDFVNRDDKSCSDFVYVKVFEPGKAQPVAKKRFYLRVKPAA